MTKYEVFQLLRLIERIYPYCLAKDETVLNWFRQCSNVEYEKVLRKLMFHIRASPYPPSMAELLTSKETSYTWVSEYSPRKRVTFL